MGYCGLAHLFVLTEMLRVHVNIYAPLYCVHPECTLQVHFSICGCLLAKYPLRYLPGVSG